MNRLRYNTRESEVNDLNDTLKKMHVDRRMSNISDKTISTFIEDEEDEEDDDTFEPDNSNDSLTSTTTEMEEEDDTTIALLIQEKDAPIPGTFESTDDGASDFCPSDVEIEQEQGIVFEKLNRKSASKYIQRGESTFSFILNPNPNLPQRPFNETPHFVANLCKFNSDQKEWRWVNKGPVLVYFAKFGQKIQLVANYLYGIKSVVLNMSLQERCYNSFHTVGQKDLLFTSGGYNCITKAETDFQTRYLRDYFPNVDKEYANDKIIECKSILKTVPEEYGSFYCLRFQTELDRTQFNVTLALVTRGLEQEMTRLRINSFKFPIQVRDVQFQVIPQVPPKQCPYVPDEDIQMFSKEGFSYLAAMTPSGLLDGIICETCRSFSFQSLKMHELKELHHTFCRMRTMEAPQQITSIEPLVVCIRH